MEAMVRTTTQPQTNSRNNLKNAGEYKVDTKDKVDVCL